MSERSSVRLEQLLGDNYYIDKWSVDDPSPAVGDTVHVTLVVYDVFNEPVGGQTRTVTCTGGSFVGVNGQSITATDSVDVITKYGSGDVELELSVDVADVITVSSGRAECVVCSLSDSITNHTHDNRYYTEAEVRSLINQSIKIVFSGQIEFGNLSANGGNATKTANITIPSGYSVLTVFPRTWYGCDNFSIVSISGSTISVRAWNLTANSHGAWVTVGAICIKNG